MDWVLAAIGSVGITTLVAAFFLWRRFADLAHEAAQADIWRLKYEEAERKIEKLQKSRELLNQPRPDSWPDIVDGL